MKTCIGVIAKYPKTKKQETLQNLGTQFRKIKIQHKAIEIKRTPKISAATETKKITMSQKVYPNKLGNKIGERDLVERAG